MAVNRAFVAAAHRNNRLAPPAFHEGQRASYRNTPELDEARYAYAASQQSYDGWSDE